jgi:predicted small secreted protein
MITQSKHILALLFVAVLLAVVSVGCNTYRGFGKDVSNTGDAIQDKR